MNSTASPASPVRAVLFDAYGTLFDVYSVGVLAEQFFPGQGQALGVLWRDKQIEYTRLVTQSAAQDSPADAAPPFYRPFWELTRAALRYCAKRLQLDLTPSRENALMNQYLQLTAFPENKEVLQGLRARGIQTGILSNGNPEMLHAVIESAGLTGLLDHVLSIDPIRRFKTHPEAYRLGLVATGLPAAEIGFVSCNAWDALAATWFGYQTLWVNRWGLPFEELGTQPSHSGTNLLDALTAFA
ncbi:MAG: haloacid dehalogenase type II [Burkholderiaceae bacterium]